MGEEWASGDNDPGYTGDGYEKLQSIVTKIGELQKKTDYCHSMDDNHWFDEWASATKEFAAHCRSVYHYLQGRHEYFDTAETDRKVRERVDDNKSVTEALGMAYLMARYNLARAPAIEAMTPEDQPRLAEFNYWVEETNRTIDELCKDQLASTTEYGRRVLDERRRSLHNERS